MCLVQIGEVANKLSDGFTERYRNIEWSSIIGFRNIIVHRYETMNSIRI